MAEIVRMPKMSDTMTEGVIVKWHKKVGDVVKSGELMAEIETDKATMDYESFHSGTVLHLGAGEGDTVQVNNVLAVVGDQGEDFIDLLKAGSNGVLEATPVAEPTTTESIDVSSINAEIVLMPKMSDTMTEGVIVKWHKQVGDTVGSGDLMAEIETDKATMEYESYNAGTLLYVGAKEQESMQVNDVLAIVGDKDADWETLLKASAQQAMASSEVTAAEPVAANTQQAVAAAPTAQSSTSQAAEGGRIKASPLARKMATDLGYALSDITGTGDNGRIIKNDVENHQPVSVAATGIIPQVTGQEGYDDVPHSQMRKTIARRLAESKFTAPHFYLTMEINMDKAMEARKGMNDFSETKISFNDLVIKAAAAALRKNPDVNVSWMDDKIRKNHHVHIGVAVAVPDGLVVPVVRFADSKSLSHIAAEVKDLAGKAHDKKLQPADWEGSTFTISNLGMFGVEEFTAIINPPDACILAVGGIKQTIVVKDGAPAVGHVMKVTLSCDHRAVDGATGASFLKSLKELLEEPVKILV